MNARLALSLGLGAAVVCAALLIVGLRQLGVRSYGYPVGRVVRAGNALAVLIQTREPYMPSLRGVPESRMSYRYSLWLIPADGSGPPRKLPVARAIRSADRPPTIGVHAYERGVVWLQVTDLIGIDASTGQVVRQAPAPAIANMPVSQLLATDDHPLDTLRARGVNTQTSTWLGLATDEEARNILAPGARVSDNDDAVGTYQPRRLYLATLEQSPRPRITSAIPAEKNTYKNGAILRTGPGGAPVRYTGPDGLAVIHEQGSVTRPTIRITRVDLAGREAWTLDTTISRVTQCFPDAVVPIIVGEQPSTDMKMGDPVIAIVHLATGAVQVVSLCDRSP